MRHLLAVVALVLLAGCGSNPPPPDWKSNAESALDHYKKAYLDGNVKVADLSYVRARAEAARTGQPAWVARVELVRCATRAAALDFAGCPPPASLMASAGAEEKSYADFLQGHWQDIDLKALPEQYASIVKSGVSADLGQIDDPLSRLIAASVLFRRGELTPVGLDKAIATASERGWRRPLLAWLGVALKRAEAGGDPVEVARLRQRIGLVESSQSR